jgi:GMP synthase (glutamine-hydrolysing)
MKVLLLQARRPDDPMMAHEQECFAGASGLGRDGFEFVNVVDGVPTMTLVSRHDALMVGGAGHFNVSEPVDGFFEPLTDLLLRVVDEGFPTFASCFGFQLLVHALGGRVEYDPDRAEVGSFEVRLTEAGADDEIFSTLPERFTAQMGHKDRAVEMPADVPNLASSERSPLQALRIPGKPIWATQFHPELDQRTNRDRYLAYIERYDPQRLGEGASGFTALPSPETSTLLPLFLEAVGR